MSQSPHRPSPDTPHRSASSHASRADVDAACISEIVGDVNCAEVGRGVVYRALRDIVCTGCGAPVRQGELFTRWRLRHTTNLFDDPNGAPPRLAARCRACVCFTDEAIELRVAESVCESNVQTEVTSEVRTSSHRSPLLAHLLAGAGASKIPTTNENATNDGDQQSPAAISPHEAAHEASYRRLAPALHAKGRSDLRSGAFRKTVPVKRKF